MRERVQKCVGWMLLTWAAVVGRTVAGRSVVIWGRRRRNRAMYGACSRGVPVPALAAWTGLSVGHVKALLRAPDAHADEERGE